VPGAARPPPCPPACECWVNSKLQLGFCVDPCDSRACPHCLPFSPRPAARLNSRVPRLLLPPVPLDRPTRLPLKAELPPPPSGAAHVPAPPLVGWEAITRVDAAATGARAAPAAGDWNGGQQPGAGRRALQTAAAAGTLGQPHTGARQGPSLRRPSHDGAGSLKFCRQAGPPAPNSQPPGTCKGRWGGRQAASRLGQPVDRPP
jgi:hypothetical protein